MTTDEWHDILTLLTIVILADRKVYKEEVDCFTKQVKRLNETISPEIFMTESMALDWFKSNRDRVKNLLVGPKVDQNIRQIILRTKNVPGKSAIIKTMKSIANADSLYHQSEHDVIRRAAYSWGVAYS